MEDAWNHITLSNQATAAAAFSAFPSTVLQGFLSAPFNRDHTHRIADSSTPSLGGRTNLFDSPAPPLTMALSLNSGSEIRLGSSPSSGPSASDFASHKRGRENGDRSGERHQRRMKNRESAARSRARKQAYTYELELAVDRLKQENARLRMQQIKLLAASKKQGQPPNKQTLYRTLSAPF